MVNQLVINQKQFNIFAPSLADQVIRYVVALINYVGC